MANTRKFPEGKKETIQINVNKDFKEETKKAILPILEKYHLLKGETEPEYIKRIQSMHLEKCSNEALIDLKSK